MKADNKVIYLLIVHYNSFSISSVSCRDCQCFYWIKRRLPADTWEKGLVMEVFLEQVDNRVTVMATLSNKVNTSVICHTMSRWPSFYFQLFLIILHDNKTISPSPLHHRSKLASKDMFQVMNEYYFFQSLKFNYMRFQFKKCFTENVFLLVNNNW